MYPDVLMRAVRHPQELAVSQHTSQEEMRRAMQDLEDLQAALSERGKQEAASTQQQVGWVGAATYIDFQS
jgi:hypothetical protein